MLGFGVHIFFRVSGLGFSWGLWFGGLFGLVGFQGLGARVLDQGMDGVVGVGRGDSLEESSCRIPFPARRGLVPWLKLSTSHACTQGTGKLYMSPQGEASFQVVLRSLAPELRKPKRKSQILGCLNPLVFVTIVVVIIMIAIVVVITLVVIVPKSKTLQPTETPEPMSPLILSPQPSNCRSTAQAWMDKAAAEALRQVLGCERFGLRV